MRSSVAQFLARHARRICILLHGAPTDLGGDFPAQAIRAMLGRVIEPGVVDDWLDAVDPAADWASAATRPLTAIAELLVTADRRSGGVFLTPDDIAAAMAACIDVRPEGRDGGAGRVLDLSAGAGGLLVAGIKANPRLTAIGVEQRPELAIAAALNILEARREAPQPAGSLPDQIFVGDGLSEHGPWTRGKAAAVLGNPPYVGEKGNREMFARLRAAHPHLEHWHSPRMDLLYLFMHRGLDLLEEGGRYVQLTSEYWLTASGAASLRADLWTRSHPELLVTFPDARIFEDAPGHHSLLLVGRGASSAIPAAPAPFALRYTGLRGDLRSTLTGFLGPESNAFTTTSAQVFRPPAACFTRERWAPFVAASTIDQAQARALYTTPLSELAADYQGFVSGADRVSRRHGAFCDDAATLQQGLRPGIGAPIFMASGELPSAWEPLLGLVVRPVLRGSQIQANTVVIQPSQSEYVLFIDGPVSEVHERVLGRHLEVFRPTLERRREVQSGGMPWYRLHWPRSRRDQTAPKLVVPRRAPEPRFCLDLSASAISSDCTYLVAPSHVQDPIRYLVGLMLLLNGEQTALHLKAFGKRKGSQLEFYSQPLRSLPIAAALKDGELVLAPELWSGAEAAAFWDEVDAIIAPLHVP